ncbi:Hypothetical predicted protein [Pelobates cultripes]|uniref:Uncharacterized protein n=1 Tax=Pelobates cultripes TaxID=61616 RepID=A0AAD1VRA7_PELCU|nr:Hypothetical predicted protein [Pelobates cultripes]
METLLVNISSRVLSVSEISVLNKGLGFVPLFDGDKLDLDIELYEFFQEGVIRDNLPTDVQIQEPELEVNCVDLSKCKNKRDEWRAVGALRSDDSIIIRAADKGEAIVVMDIDKYNAEAMAQLSNRVHYEKLSRDPTKEFQDSIGVITLEALNQGLINKKIFEFLNTFSVPASQNPQGSFESPWQAHCVRLWFFAYIDAYLQVLVVQMRSYIRDTSDFWGKLDNLGSSCRDSLLCTIDVCSLYTSIPDSGADLDLYVPSIKFTLEHDASSIHFLDVQVNKIDDGLCFDLFRKPTDKVAFLQANSFHPASMIRSLPFSQLLHVRRIVSQEANFDTQAQDFRSRGYNDTSLQETLAKAKNRERTSLLRTKGKNKRNKSNRIPCVTTYSSKSGLVKHVINKNWHVLQSDPEIADFFKERPLMAYKRSPSRARISSKPSTTWLTPIKGMHRCGHCANCNNVITGSEFTHPRTGKAFAIKELLITNRHR